MELDIKQLRTYVTKHRRWVALLVVGPLVAGVTAFAVSSRLPSVYQADATLLIRPATTATGSTTSLTDQDFQTYAELLRQRPLLITVIQELNLSITPEALQKSITVKSEAGTRLLVVSAQGRSAAQAQAIVNRLTSDFVAAQQQGSDRRLKDYTDRLQKQLQAVEADIAARQSKIDQLNGQAVQRPLSADQQVQLLSLQQAVAADHAQYSEVARNLALVAVQAAQGSDALEIVAPAIAPVTPSSPHPFTDALLAASVAFIAIAALMVLTDYLDRTVKSLEDLAEGSGLVPLGQISYRATSSSRKKPSIADDSLRSDDEFNRIRASIVYANIDTQIKSILLTSAHPGEGKSRTAAHLALALARAGYRTLLVDADLRRPSQHRIFGFVRNTGLTNLLLQEQDLDALVRNGPGPGNLWVLTSGPIPPNPSELLGSARMSAVLKEFTNRFSFVIIDAPPVTPVADPLVLSSKCDATILVAQVDRTTIDVASATKANLERMGARVIGGILNMVRQRELAYPYRDYVTSLQTGEAESPAHPHSRAR